MTFERALRWAAVAAAYSAVFAAAAVVGGLGYFHYADPRQTCTSCHEMAGAHADWTQSSHRTIACRTCHGGALTLDVHALQSHVRRVMRHFSGGETPNPRLRPEHVAAVHASCAQCHPQAFADWQASRHSTTYGRILLDPVHNASEPPADDCLRCHGQFFAGTMTELVASSPDRRTWRLRDPAKHAQPMIPCLVCHQVHAAAASTEIASLYSRREGVHIPAQLLPVVTVQQGGNPVKVSRDPRQRVCAQCHAPAASRELGSSDDRTAAGVHEGLSCRDCHWSHNNSATASCKACHPADSHCGLDVEKMDTTYRSTDSRHNIHRVACIDCHPSGVPASRPVTVSLAGK